jgi:acyl carrier protein
MSQTTLNELEPIFHDVFADETIQLSRETTAADIPGWDSVEQINLMFTVEQTFGVQFSGKELSGFANVGDLADAIERKRGAYA